MKDPIKMIQDCQEIDEPTFTIRAKDKIALDALGCYLLQCTLKGCTTEYCDEIAEMLKEFTLYRNSHPNLMKTPD